MGAPLTGKKGTTPLNAAQRAAVEHLQGALLVVAGAGTGKTRVIVERVLYLLETIPDLQGENILAITFTNKAADEMAARIRRRGDRRAPRVGVYTFHGFCYELLRQHNQALNILDQVDYWIFLRRRLDQLGLDLYKKLSEPGRFLKAFLEFFSRCQDELVSPEDYAGYVAGRAAAFEQEKSLLSEEESSQRLSEIRREQEIARAYAAAERLLRDAQLTTFGGLLLSAVELLQSDRALREQWQERLRYLVVDEFQDTNIAQITLLHLLAGKHRNLLVVGDDDQAIYRFRGASYASFRKFIELFPGCRRITLAQNYRSTTRILRVATTLIAQNGTARFDPNKTLRASRPGGEKVQLAEVDKVDQEAAYVASAIADQHRRTGTYAGIAVLYRAHVHRNALVAALARGGIPFVIRGLSILSHRLVRDLVACLRAIHSPDDNVSLARLLAHPAWHLTPERLLELIHRAARERTTLAAAIESLHPRVRDAETRLGELLRLLADLRSRAEAVSLRQLLEDLLERLSLRLLPSDPDRPYLDAFVNFLRRWEAEKSESRRLGEFVQYLDYFEEAGGAIDLPEDSDNRDAVQLMTVHAAKGLEFDSVFVLRVNQNDFPTMRRRPLFEFPAALMKEALPPGDFHIQEERRLFYVALTRARQRLAITTLTGVRKKPSVFLEDILREPQAAAEVRQQSPALQVPTPVASEPVSPTPDSAQGRLFPPQFRETRCSRVAEWAVGHRGPPLRKPLALSHSALETYQRCPLKYKLAHVWQLPAAPSPAMRFGQLMHRTLTEFARARQRQPSLPLEELQHIYEQQWRQTPWPFRDAYQEQEYQASGWEQLRGFYQYHVGRPPAALELEKTFRWGWEDVVLTGRIDQIDRLPGGGVEIIEYKTGEPRPRPMVEKSLQLALYALAAQHHLGLRPERLTLYNLTVNEPISFAPAERTSRQALETVREVAARIRHGEFAARPGYHCRYCDYQRICPEHEQPPPVERAAATSVTEDESEED